MLFSVPETIQFLRVAILEALLNYCFYLPKYRNKDKSYKIDSFPGFL